MLQSHSRSFFPFFLGWDPFLSPSVPDGDIIYPSRTKRHRDEKTKGVQRAAIMARETWKDTWLLLFAYWLLFSVYVEWTQWMCPHWGSSELPVPRIACNDRSDRSARERKSEKERVLLSQQAISEPSLTLTSQYSQIFDEMDKRKRIAALFVPSSDWLTKGERMIGERSTGGSRERKTYFISWCTMF